MKIGVVTFPGSLDDRDAARAIERAGGQAVSLWHNSDNLKEVSAVVLPGGFSYGDYLRCGAIASFAPIMQSIVIAANHGFPVLGICNGFQILCESHLLPGVLTRNHELHFLCRDQKLKIENNSTAWTSGFKSNQEILIPIKNGEGSYQCDDATLALTPIPRLLLPLLDLPLTNQERITVVGGLKALLCAASAAPQARIAEKETELLTC